MYTGNLIGKRRILYQGNAGGIWKPSEVYNAISEKIWPTNGLYIIGYNQNQDSTTITQPTGVVSGDLLLVFNIAINNTSATAPTAVTPSGYTNIYNITRSSASTGQRMTFYYKIADGTESGASITGMNGPGYEYLVVYLIRRTSGAVSSVTVTDLETDVAFTGTVTKTVATGSSTAPAILFVGHRSFYSVMYYFSDGTYELPNYGINDTRSGFGDSGDWYNNFDINPNITTNVRTHMTSLGTSLKILNYPGTPDISVTIKGDGSFDFLATGYLQIA